MGFAKWVENNRTHTLEEKILGRNILEQVLSITTIVFIFTAIEVTITLCPYYPDLTCETKSNYLSLHSYIFSLYIWKWIYKETKRMN